MASLTAIAAVVAAQTVVHLVLAMAADRPRTRFDVEHSNGIPDLVSSGVLALATGAALAIAAAKSGRPRIVALLAAVVFGVLTVADLLHGGAHPLASTTGVVVVVLVILAAVLVSAMARNTARRCQITLAVAGALLAASFLTSGIDRFERFQGRRGDIVKEGRLVAKEGLELLGWSLAALALWDEALRLRQASRPGATGRASRAPAAPTRRAA